MHGSFDPVQSIRTGGVGVARHPRHAPAMLLQTGKANLGARHGRQAEARGYPAGNT